MCKNDVYTMPYTMCIKMGLAASLQYLYIIILQNH